ncbi:hypothetical protein B0H66DRAFT_383734 [Apodospora peruviana]|uniref:N-acetyltransferase domain-containing protein n=1 Tax=Apodospora peruviana TaxID=516989 RepID=A0AAE0HUV1_9PEZI|nr:hypothetical protein B0H66DRAFT_383734 [Apodospora peruviana]
MNNLLTRQDSATPPITPIPDTIISVDTTSTRGPFNTQPTVLVAMADPSLASDEAFINHLTKLVNEVYTAAEEGIFNSEYRRTNLSELRKLILNSELALAWQTAPVVQTTTAAPPPTDDSLLIGCARIQSVPDQPTHGVFGMLVCDPKFRGAGAGRDLVRFAEHYAKNKLRKTVMQCELLVSTEFTHPFKARMQEWYERMGYKVVRIGDFGKECPHLKPCLVTDVEFRVFEKPLV